MSHGVEQPHALTLFWMCSLAAACRIFSASGGVKFSTTAPFLPAAWTSCSATEFALWIGTLVVNVWIGTFAALVIAIGPAAM